MKIYLTIFILSLMCHVSGWAHLYLGRHWVVNSRPHSLCRSSGPVFILGTLSRLFRLTTFRKGGIFWNVFQKFHSRNQCGLRASLVLFSFLSHHVIELWNLVIWMMMDLIVMQVGPYIDITLLLYIVSYKMHRMWIHLEGMMTSIHFTTLGPGVAMPTTWYQSPGLGSVDPSLRPWS